MAAFHRRLHGRLSRLRKKYEASLFPAWIALSILIHR